MNQTTEINFDGNVAAWIWKNLVPKSGQADTVQGELLRSIEKLRWESQNNGNGNWDDGFEKLLTFLSLTLTDEIRLTSSTLSCVSDDIKRLGDYDCPYVEDDLFDRLTDAAVAYCRLNPKLLPKSIDPTLRR